MIPFARPTPSEERWLDVAEALGRKLPADAIAARTGGWHGTGLLARIAMFVLGVLAVALIGAVFGLGGTTAMLIAGLIASFAAESLARGKRLFASGIEEGLCLGGWLLLAGWVLTLFDSFGVYAEDLYPPVLIAAAMAAGLRLLSPFITTVAVIAFVRWIGWEAASWPMLSSVGASVTSLVIGSALAAGALWLGGRTFQRPSHDRMLDWAVAALPVASYSSSMTWVMFDPTSAASFPVGRWLVLVILVALAALMLVTGIRRRRHAPLISFIGCALCIAVELRFVTHLSTEARLIIGGLLALLVGAVLDRYLREPRHGLTSRSVPGGESPLDILQTAGAAVITHDSNASLPQPEAPVNGGGGRFGGGGASGSF